MRGKAFPAEIFELAVKLSGEGKTVRAISIEIQVCESTIRRWLDRGQQMRRLYSEDDRIIIPPEVLAERDRRRELCRPTYTAEFFGDPLPGYSALDRSRNLEGVGSR